MNTEWKCKVVLGRSQNRHLLWMKTTGRNFKPRSAAKTGLAKESQKAFLGLGKAKRGLYKNLYTVFFYKESLLPMKLAKTKKNIFLAGNDRFKCIPGQWSLWLQVRKHSMDSPIGSKGLQCTTVSLWSFMVAYHLKCNLASELATKLPCRISEWYIYSLMCNSSEIKCLIFPLN